MPTTLAAAATVNTPTKKTIPVGLFQFMPSIHHIAVRQKLSLYPFPSCCCSSSHAPPNSTEDQRKSQKVLRPEQPHQGEEI